MTPVHKLGLFIISNSWTPARPMTTVLHELTEIRVTR